MPAPDAAPGNVSRILTPDVDPARPSRLLEDVLTRPEFGASSSDGPTWLQRAVDSLAQLVGNAPAWMETALLAAVIGGALLLIVALLRGGLVGARRTATAQVADEDDAAERREPAAELYRRGQEAHAAGRYSDAVVLLFRAIVHRLAEVGLLLDDPSRTNREHQLDLRRRQEEGRAFASAARPFERVRYGQGDATAEDAQLVDAAARLVFAPRSARP